MLSGNRSTRTSSGTAPQQRSRFSSPVELGSRESFLATPRWPQLTLTTTRLARSRQAGSTLESSPDLPPTHSADQNAGSRKRTPASAACTRNGWGGAAMRPNAGRYSCVQIKLQTSHEGGTVKGTNGSAVQGGAVMRVGHRGDRPRWSCRHQPEAHDRRVLIEQNDEWRLQHRYSRS